MFRVERSNKGKPSIIDRNQFKYVANGESMTTARWRCSKRECKASLQTTKSYSSLIGEILPEHNHINNLLKRAAKDTEAAVLTKFAKVHGSRPTQVIQEISANMLGSDLPGQIHCASSTSAIKSKLWRLKQVSTHTCTYLISKYFNLLSSIHPIKIWKSLGWESAPKDTSQPRRIDEDCYTGRV